MNLWITISFVVLYICLEIYRWFKDEKERYNKLLKDYDKLDRKYDCCLDELNIARNKIRDLQYIVDKNKGV